MPDDGQKVVYGGNCSGSGGAGNPGGTGQYGGARGGYGTGGLLVLYASIINNTGMIQADGSAGGSGGNAGGGGSGGGSINIFYTTSIINGNITASSGLRGNGTAVGGYGGMGCITIGNISTGTFIKDE